MVGRLACGFSLVTNVGCGDGYVLTLPERVRLNIAREEESKVGKGSWCPDPCVIFLSEVKILCLYKISKNALCSA